MFTEKDLADLIGEVEKEFSSYLGKAETALAKSEEASLIKAEDDKQEKKKDEKPEAKEEKKDDKQPEAKADFPAEKQDEMPAAAAPAPDQAQEQAAPAADAMMQDQQAGHGYDEEDLAHMEAMYASMSREELIAHHDAIKMVLDSMGMEKCGDMSMVKSEKDETVEVKPEIVIETSQESQLLKSELATKDGKIQELQKTLDAVTAFVTKLVEKRAAPQGKAITQLDTIAKSESETVEKVLSKQEITDLLNKKASDPKLEKSDREAINSYYSTGQINLTGISHLLK